MYSPISGNPVGFRPMERRIDVYVSVSYGNDTTGSGSATSPFYTITKALSHISELVDIDYDCGVTIHLGAGSHSIPSSGLDLTENTWWTPGQIAIVGDTVVESYISSVVAATGTGTNRLIQLQLGDVTGIEEDDYALITDVDILSGNSSEGLCGCWRVSSVNTLNNRIQIEYHSHAGTTPSSECRARIRVLKTKLECPESGITCSTQYSRVLLDNLVLVGAEQDIGLNTEGYTNLSLHRVGIVGYSTGLVLRNGTSCHMLDCGISANTDGVRVIGNSHLYASLLSVCGNDAVGIELLSNSQISVLPEHQSKPTNQQVITLFGNDIGIQCQCNSGIDAHVRSNYNTQSNVIASNNATIEIVDGQFSGSVSTSLDIDLSSSLVLTGTFLVDNSGSIGISVSGNSNLYFSGSTTTIRNCSTGIRIRGNSTLISLPETIVFSEYNNVGVSLNVGSFAYIPNSSFDYNDDYGIIVTNHSCAKIDSTLNLGNGIASRVNIASQLYAPGSSNVYSVVGSGLLVENRSHAHASFSVFTHNVRYGIEVDGGAYANIWTPVILTNTIGETNITPDVEGPGSGFGALSFIYKDPTP